MSMLSTSLVVLAVASLVQARPLARDDPVQHLSKIEHGDVIFSLGDIPYLALTTTPYAESSDFSGEGNLPFTVVKFDQCSITADDVDALINKYLEGDDVISESFLQSLYISTSCEDEATMDSSALDYLTSMGAKAIYISSSVTCKGAAVTIDGPDGLEPGPYIASIEDGVARFSSVYRLYEDRYRTFIFGAYEDPSSNNTFKPFPVNIAKYQDPLIPVPSRIYSWSDKRPFAGFEFRSRICTTSRDSRLLVVAELGPPSLLLQMRPHRPFSDSST